MNSRRLVLGSVGVFGLIWAVLLVLAWRAGEQAEIVVDDLVTEVVTTSTASFSLAEVATHSSPDDCWIVVKGAVYDVSTYIDRHPAARRTITDYCGKESTTAFETKERGRDHSASACKLLESYRLGVLR